MKPMAVIPSGGGSRRNRCAGANEMANRTILLIEDEESVCGFLKQLLEKAGWKVSTATSASEALGVLANVRFEIILSDLDLGAGLSGIDIQRSLPNESRGTPLIILTGHGTVDRCKEAIRSGVADFVEKPVSPTKLLSAIEAALSQQFREESASIDSTAAPMAVGDVHIRLAMRTIDRHFADADLSVASLARSVDVSPEHLARLFRRHTGRSPLDHIHARRIAAAEELLRNPKLSIYEVALECGYRRTADLDEWFGRLRQITPSESRSSSPSQSRKSEIRNKDQVSGNDCN